MCLWSEFEFKQVAEHVFEVLCRSSNSTPIFDKDKLQFRKIYIGKL